MKFVFVWLGVFSIIFFGVHFFYMQAYPVKYQNEIAVACEKFGVEKYVIFAVVNVESKFDKTAKSQKGAVGLMQLMPSTASEVATKIGLTEFDLENPSDNILLGTCYLSQLINKFSSLDFALCAYNAGPANVSAWLEKDENLENIPFQETKNYLKKCKKCMKYYKKVI